MLEVLDILTIGLDVAFLIEFGSWCTHQCFTRKSMCLQHWYCHIFRNTQSEINIALPFKGNMYYGWPYHLLPYMVQICVFHTNAISFNHYSHMNLLIHIYKLVSNHTTTFLHYEMVIVLVTPIIMDIQTTIAQHFHIIR